MQSKSLATFRWLAAIVFIAMVVPLAAAQETELKDETGKTILKYVIEVPPGIAPAGTVDPARQVGLILCSQEHDTPTGNDLFPVVSRCCVRVSSINTCCWRPRRKAVNSVLTITSRSRS